MKPTEEEINQRHSLQLAKQSAIQLGKECQRWWEMISSEENRKKFIVINSRVWRIYVVVRLWHATDFNALDCPYSVEVEIWCEPHQIRTIHVSELTKSTLFTSSTEALDFAASMNELEGLG